jgi:2-polyprenyl-3-methyl-5-hydroxy-6-metoxy-1,4-benzoquinol methylase
MGSIERLTLEESTSGSLEALEHVHRYLVASDLCRGSRVLDLCCGSGYGSRILRDACPVVAGVDIDEPTIRLAEATLGGEEGLSFEAADALEVLERPLDVFDAIVMLEGLEHLSEPSRAIQGLERHAAAGLSLVVSIPNSKTFAEENPFHVSDFDYDVARQICSRFERGTLVYQFLAEGSLVRIVEDDGLEVRFVEPERGEREYANHFLLCVNCDPESIGALTARMQLAVTPTHMRYFHGLEQANLELRRANVRLARERLGVADSAAATLLAKVDRLETALRESRARIKELDRARAHDEWVQGLHDQIDQRQREIEAMKATRAWRLAGSYWALRDRVLRRVSREP